MPSRPEPPAGDLDAVLERMSHDGGFRDAVVRDPRAALAGYALSADELRELTNRLADDHESLDPVEQRTSKAGLFALFSGALARVGERRQVLAPEVIGFQQPGPGDGSAPGGGPVTDHGGGVDGDAECGSGTASAASDPGDA